MLTSTRTLEPAGSPGARPKLDPLTRQMDAMVDEGGPDGSSKPQQSESRGTGTFGAVADASGDVMRSMAMDPVSAARQTLGAVRRHPYMTAVLVLLFGAVIAGLARS
jgi:hypothetical protein